MCCDDDDENCDIISRYVCFIFGIIVFYLFNVPILAGYYFYSMAKIQLRTIVGGFYKIIGAFIIFNLFICFQIFGIGVILLASLVLIAYPTYHPVKLVEGALAGLGPS